MACDERWTFNMRYKFKSNILVGIYTVTFWVTEKVDSGWTSEAHLISELIMLVMICNAESLRLLSIFQWSQARSMS